MQSALVLFDGVCNLCNASVRFLYRRDPRANLRFANLQSDAARRLLPRFNLPAHYLDSFVLIEGEICYTRSTAALRVLRYLHFPWPLLSVLLIIPAPLRDPVYDWIARNRYRWFGRRDSCLLPTPDLQARFLS